MQNLIQNKFNTVLYSIIVGLPLIIALIILIISSFSALDPAPSASGEIQGEYTQSTSSHEITRE